MTICQPEMEGEDTVDALFEIVEIGMGGIDCNIVFDKGDDGTASGIGRCDAFDAAEDEGMMGDNEVGAKGNGFVDNSRGEVEGDKSPRAFAVRIAEEESGIVVVFLVFGMEFAVEELNDFGYCHDDGVLISNVARQEILCDIMSVTIWCGRFGTVYAGEEVHKCEIKTKKL